MAALFPPSLWKVVPLSALSLVARARSAGSDSMSFLVSAQLCVFIYTIYSRFGTGFGLPIGTFLLRIHPACGITDHAGREGIFLSPAFNLSVRSGTEVIITHAPSTSDAWEMHTDPVEKSIASVTSRLC